MSCPDHPVQRCGTFGGCAGRGGPCEGCYYENLRRHLKAPTTQCVARREGELAVHCACFVSTKTCCFCGLSLALDQLEQEKPL